MLPEFIKNVRGINISKKAAHKAQFWQTLFISGGRKDKISKGDIAGLFFKQGEINKDQLGSIELKQDCAFVAVPKSIADDLGRKLKQYKIKKEKSKSNGFVIKTRIVNCGSNYFDINMYIRALN